MKPQLSKEEVEQLDEQQLEAYVNVVRATEMEQRRLLDNASSYRGRWSSGYVFIVLLVALNLWRTPSIATNTILCLAIFIVLQIHTMGLNRRIDSVMRLLHKKDEGAGD